MTTNEQWGRIIKKYKGKRVSRSQAIKNYCKLECCAGDLESWKNCTITNCFLWRFRLGKEILGNSTSFKKTKAKQGILEQINDSTEEVLEERGLNDS